MSRKHFIASKGGEMTYTGTLTRYAVAIHHPEEGTWIEFYMAEDRAHAEEQAENANPESDIVSAAIVPEA